MNKCIKTMVISLLLILSMPMAKLSAQVSTWDGTYEPWTHGTGTEADPFLIENAQQLAYLAYRVNNGLDAGGGHVSNHDYHYKLMVDVDLNGSEDFQWTPIGYWNSDADYQCFGGHFDGNNYVITNLYISSNANRIGLFGFVNNAIIENLNTVQNTVVTTNYAAGGIVGSAIGTTSIRNCNNLSGSVSSEDSSGGILGSCLNNAIVHISNCSNHGEVSSHKQVGGIAGCIYYSDVSIINCYNKGNVEVSGGINYQHAGGILGLNFVSTAIVTNCYNTGNASIVGDGHSHFAGGVVGLSSYNVANVTNCYNVGNVAITSYGNVGGIGNIDYGGSVNAINCYYLNTCGGNNTYGGEPKTSVYMKSPEFIDVLNSGTDIWTQDIYNVNQGYPIFSDILYMSITTTDATNITQTHSTLNGSTYPEEMIVSSGFEYKKASDLSFQTITIPGSGTISTTLSGLEPNTQYQYRVFCILNDNSTYYGGVKTFTTLPVSITTYSATDVAATSATLHGSIDVGDATLINKGFEYREVGETDYITINIVENANVFAAQLSELQVNTTYEYRTFLNVAESPSTYYGSTKTFEVTWLNLDTICVYDAEMLRWVSEQCNSGITFEGKCIKLMNDITLPLNVPNNMTSIGAYPNYPFKGTFDGNGKLITNLYIDQPNTPYQGFFGYTLNANLYNVGLVNITASGRNYTGGMVAYAKNTYMRDCYVNGGTLFALSYCGGLMGYQEQGTNSIISGCYNTCEVTGNNYVGGLIGFSNYSTVRNSYVAGRVSAQGEPVGAIIGGANEVLMYYCYFSTELTGQTNAIGWNNIGKDGGQMRDPQFVNTLNQNLTTPVWMADYTNHINNGFPIIKWQRPGTGVEEHDAAKSCISLYPNPANDFVIIQSDDSNVSLKYVEVYDVTGRMVMSEVLDGQNQMFNVAKLVSGVYHVRVQTSNGCCTNLKLIVQ